MGKLWPTNTIDFILTHWGRGTHICVGNQTTIGSDDGLPPGRRQHIIWTDSVILLIGPLGTNFSEISIGILTFSLNKMRLRVSSVKWRPFGLGFTVLMLGLYVLTLLLCCYIVWLSRLGDKTKWWPIWKIPLCTFRHEFHKYSLKFHSGVITGWDQVQLFIKHSLFTTFSLLSAPVGRGQC